MILQEPWRGNEAHWHENRMEGRWYSSPERWYRSVLRKRSLKASYEKMGESKPWVLPTSLGPPTVKAERQNKRT